MPDRGRGPLGTTYGLTPWPLRRDCLPSKFWALFGAGLGWAGAQDFPCTQVLPSTPSLSPQRRGVGWGPLRCSLPGPCQAPPPASSTSRSTCARLWMANARRSPRYSLAPHPVSLHTAPMLRLCSPSPDVTLGCAPIPSLSQAPPAPAAIMSSPDSAREGLGAEGQAN